MMQLPHSCDFTLHTTEQFHYLHGNLEEYSFTSYAYIVGSTTDNYEWICFMFTANC